MTTFLLEEHQYVMFPPLEVRSYTVSENCSNCSQRVSETNNVSLLKYNHCNLTVLAKNVGSSYKAGPCFRKESLHTVLRVFSFNLGSVSRFCYAYVAYRSIKLVLLFLLRNLIGLDIMPVLYMCVAFRFVSGKNKTFGICFLTFPT